MPRGPTSNARIFYHPYTEFKHIFTRNFLNFCLITVNKCVLCYLASDTLWSLEGQRLERLGTGEWLLRARRSRMWTQGRLAAEAGVSPTTVSGIETGRILRPRFGTVRKLAWALNVNPSDLLSAGEPPGKERHDFLSLGWARSIQEAEFEQGLEEASLEQLEALRRDLDEERGRLQALYGEFPEGSEQRRYIKRQIRIVAAQSGSVATSMMFREGDGNSDRADADGASAG